MTVRSLSPLESKVILTAESEAKREVTLDQIQAWASASRTHARKLAHMLSEKHWLQRVGRGRYLVNPSVNGPDAIPDRDPFRIGSSLVEPYFFSHSTAANLHGLLKQRFQEYVITTPKRKRVPKDLPVQIRFVISSSGAGDSERQERRGIDIRLSNQEQTVLECVDRPDLVGGVSNSAQIVAAAKPRMNWQRLAAAATRFERQSTVQRLGWLLDHVRQDIPIPANARKALATRVGQAYVQIDPSSPRGGPTDSQWHVQVNQPMGEILSEVKIG
jgi:predicted transcriptional regulator of viral defense system